MQLNPDLAKEINQMDRDDLMNNKDENDEHQSQLAQLISNSTLLRSYEQIMTQYEHELDKKIKVIQEFEREQ